MSYTKIKQITRRTVEGSPESCEVYDLTTTSGNFIANGVVVHNCDLRINNDLESDGYSFKGVEECWKDHSYDENGKLSEEEIYDILIKENKEEPEKGSWGVSGEGGDLEDKMVEGAEQTLINNVIQAIQQSKLSKEAGAIPNGVEELVSEFTKSVVPWERELMQFFTEVVSNDYSWKKRNRRYADIYLPSIADDEDRLEHLSYFIDVSGSISNEEIIRFNSEVKYIKEVFNPIKLTLIQFDMKIQSTKVYTESDSFDYVNIVGRGGTNFEPVKQWIDENNPTAAVIFSDMCCKPMNKPVKKVPIIWCISGSYNPPVNCGKKIQIKE